ncbi:longitudinals lacking protein, isoforms N/O/W/X/Y isoform X2 [Nilaparvata lugens]|uniref:longitudinals lacking protein, isoforms N/O/W/X/Y isoform X2 n=1 Tax=Nilaparvata lugens TaxID=108931 RepID=UPI00193D6B4A|nr:longitudinals lacking protein, isoforms N/O/W/X/Y isoform X2 [Nilaparvata lugens]
MTAEQFCLKWNNHQSTLISVFDGLFESGTLVDCTLAADGQYIKAHKVVLCACSPYLEALLSEHYNQHPIVILKDVKFEELQSILEYMYRGQVNVTQEQLGHFLKAAEMLQVKGLSENRSGAASAQIVSTKFSAVINNEKNSASVGNTASVAKPPNSAEAARKKEKVVVAFSRSTPSASPVESLLPSKLVIDIPPISPVDSKDASVSPKRKKVPHSGDIVKSDVKIGSVESASECAMNEVDDARLATATTASGFMFGVDPMITEFTAHNIKVEEYSDDSYDSDMLVVDEENAAARGGGGVKEEEQPGPSGGAVADGWKAPEGEDPEAAKGGGGRKIKEFLEYLALEPKNARKLGSPGANPASHKRKLRKRKQLIATGTTKPTAVHKIQHQIKFKTAATSNKNKIATVIRKKIINYKLQAAKKKVTRVKKEPKSAETNGVTNDTKENIGVKVVAVAALKPKAEKAKLKAALKKSSTPIDKKGAKKKMTGGMSNSMNTSDGKMFSCDNCDKAYSRKSSLYRHSTYECGKEHSFNCPYCTYGAYQKVHLNRHITFVHRQPPV